MVTAVGGTEHTPGLAELRVLVEAPRMRWATQASGLTLTVRRPQTRRLPARTPAATLPVIPARHGGHLHRAGLLDQIEVTLPEVRLLSVGLVLPYHEVEEAPVPQDL